MKNAFAVAAFCAAFSLPAWAADHLEVSAAGSASRTLAPHLQKIRDASNVELAVNTVGTGQAILDVIDGKSTVAIVSTTSLWDAVGAARVAAWSEGHRVVAVSPTLTMYPIAVGGAQPLAFVTNAAPSPQLAKVIAYLTSESGRKLLALR
jgi:DNA-binding transcriptional LysR family regulator